MVDCLGRERQRLSVCPEQCRSDVGAASNDRGRLAPTCNCSPRAGLMIAPSGRGAFGSITFAIAKRSCRLVEPTSFICVKQRAAG